MTDVPAAPSLVAVTVADPAAIPTTKPVAFTVATPGALLAHVTGRPPSGLPAASLGVAVNWTVPLAGSVAVAGLTSTEATGTGATPTVALPLLPSVVAVIDADPTASPWTSPLPFTLATAGALLCHVTVRPDSGWPFASIGVAVSCTVAPTCTVGLEGLTPTVATGTGVTLIDEVPLFPSLVAVIVTGPPALVPVTRPPAVTSATAGSLLCQVTVRPVSALPAASLGVTVS